MYRHPTYRRCNLVVTKYVFFQKQSNDLKGCLDHWSLFSKYFKDICGCFLLNYSFLILRFFIFWEFIVMLDWISVNLSGFTFFKSLKLLEKSVLERLHYTEGTIVQCLLCKESRLIFFCGTTILKVFVIFFIYVF